MPRPAPQISLLILTLMSKGAAEMRLAVGKPPLITIEHEERQLDTKTLDADDLEHYVKEITPDDVLATCDDQGRSEFGLKFSADGLMANIGVVIRKRNDRYEMVFRLLSPIEQDREPKTHSLSELSDDVN